MDSKILTLLVIGVAAIVIIAGIVVYQFAQQQSEIAKINKMAADIRADIQDKNEINANSLKLNECLMSAYDEKIQDIPNASADKCFNEILK